MKKIFVFLVTLAVTFLFSGSTAFCQYRVVVRVVSEDRQEPVEGARVKLEYSNSEDFDNALTRYENTDWDGMAFREFGSPGYSGYFRVTVTHPDFEIKTATTSMLSCKNTKCNVPVNISIPRKASLNVLAINVLAKGDRAHVYNAQIRVDGGTMTGDLYNASTDGSGNAVINVTKKGTYMVTISHAGFESITDHVTIDDDNNAYTRSYEMERNTKNVQRKVSVYVKGKNDRGVMGPVASAEVKFLGDFNYLVLSTQANGYCVSNHSRAPGEELAVTVFKEGYKPGRGSTTVSTKMMDAGFDYITVILESGTNDAIIFHINIEVLDDETNEPVSGADVKLNISDGTVQQGTTSIKGKIKFSDMEEHQGTTARVVVTKTGYMEKWSDITADLMTGKDNAERQFLVYVKKKEADDNYDFSKFSGTWQSDFGPVQLTVSKGGVSGSWNQSATETGLITGGSVDPKSKTISFKYSQPWNKKTGKVTNIYFSEDFTKTQYNLNGTWAHDDGSGKGTWRMWRNK